MFRQLQDLLGCGRRDGDDEQSRGSGALARALSGLPRAHRPADAVTAVLRLRFGLVRA